MASEDSKYKISIQTDYNGASAKEAIADQTKLGEAAERAAQVGAQSGSTGGGDVTAQRIAQRQAAFDKYDASVATADAEEISAEAKKQILLEQQLVVATQQAKLQAAAAGDKIELAQLQAELAVRQVTLATLRTTAMTQAELNEFLAAQNVLITENAAAAAAQATAQAAITGQRMGFEEIRAGAHAFHGLESAMEGSRMGVVSLTRSLHGLWELIAANSVVAAIGGILVALGMWVKRSSEARQKIIEDIGEVSKKNAELAAEIEKRGMEAKFDSLKASIAGVKTAFDEATKATREYYATEREKGDIEATTKRHENEEKERQELEGAHGDPVKEARIKQKWGDIQLKDQQDNEARKAQLNVEEASKNAARAKQAVEDNAAEKAKAESAARADASAFEETKKRVAESAQKVGVKSNEQEDLDRLAALRGMGDASRGVSGNEELYKLELNEAETRRKAAESPTFRTGKTWGDTLKGKEAPDEEITRMAARKKEFEDNIARAKSWGDKDNQAMWESQLSRATAAETLRKELPMLAERKKRAEEAEAKQQAAAEAADKQAKELADQQKEAQDKLMLAELNQTKVEAAKTSTVAKTRAENTKRVQAAELEEQRKAHEAKVKAAEAALEGAKNTDSDYAEKVDAVAKLKASGIGMRLPGTKPTDAEADLEAADKGKIAADAQKKKVAAAEAREREAARERKEWEKAGGPQVEAKSKAAAGDAITLGGTGGFNSERAVSEAGKILQGAPTNDAAIASLLSALREYRNHADAAGQQQAAQIMQEVQAIRQETQALRNKTDQIAGWYAHRE